MTFTPIAACVYIISPYPFSDLPHIAVCVYIISPYPFSDLPPIAACVQETFTNCKEENVIGDTSFIGNLVVKGFQDFVKLDKCYIKVGPPCSTNLHQLQQICI